MLCKQRGKADQKRIIGATKRRIEGNRGSFKFYSNRTAKQFIKKNIVFYRLITIIHPVRWNTFILQVCVMFCNLIYSNTHSWIFNLNFKNIKGNLKTFKKVFKFLISTSSYF